MLNFWCITRPVVFNRLNASDGNSSSQHSESAISWNIKFQENPSSWSRAIPCGRAVIWRSWQSSFRDFANTSINRNSKHSQAACIPCASLQTGTSSLATALFDKNVNKGESHSQKRLAYRPWMTFKRSITDRCFPPSTTYTALLTQTDKEFRTARFKRYAQQSRIAVR